MVSHADGLAAEPQLMGADDLGGYFADGEIPAVESAQVIAADAEASGAGGGRA